MSQAHAMSQTHAAVISPLEREAPQQACSPLGDFPRAARTSVLLAVMLIVFLSACGGSSAPETGNGTQQETSELAGDSADNTEADNTEADNTEADNTEADNTEADNTEADNTEADNTEADNTEADNTEADNTEADNTEADNTEADNTEAVGARRTTPRRTTPRRTTPRRSPLRSSLCLNATMKRRGQALYNGPTAQTGATTRTGSPTLPSASGPVSATLVLIASALRVCVSAADIPAELGNLTALQDLDLTIS